MKRILEMFGEPITYGGQESVVFNMLSTFKLGQDYIVDLFTPYYADNKGLIDLINANGGNVYSLNIEFKTNDNRFLLTKYIDDYFKEHNNYEVVHIHTGSLSSMCMYAKCAKKYGIKTVLVHAHIANNKISLSYRLRRYILCKLLDRNADKYLGCSNYAISSKWTKNIVEKSILIYNGIDIQKYKFNNLYRNEIRNKYNIDNKFVLGCVGRLNYQKNNFFMLAILNNVISKNRNIVLMIVGSGNLENELKNKCIDYGIESNVIFTGNVLDSYKYYNAFDTYIMPSLYEGMPVAAIEAQMSGVKCLISDTVTNECCISSETEFLPISDSNIWADKILNLIDNYDPANIESIRKNANINFNKFDRNKTFKIIEDIYKS